MASVATRGEKDDMGNQSWSCDEVSNSARIKWKLKRQPISAVVVPDWSRGAVRRAVRLLHQIVADTKAVDPGIGDCAHRDVGRSGPRMNARDLRALQTESPHESMLVEEHGVDASVESQVGERAGLAFVHDHEARTGGDLPAIAMTQAVEGLLVHEEERVAVMLHAGLKSVRQSSGLVEGIDASVAANQRSIAAHAADHESCLEDVGKDQDGFRPGTEAPCCWLRVVEIPERTTGIGGDFRAARVSGVHAGERSCAGALAQHHAAHDGEKQWQGARCSGSWPRGVG